jgi:hypothetical protein
MYVCIYIYIYIYICTCVQIGRELSGRLQRQILWLRDARGPQRRDLRWPPGCHYMGRYLFFIYFLSSYYLIIFNAEMISDGLLDVTAWAGFGRDVTVR